MPTYFSLFSHISAVVGCHMTNHQAPTYALMRVLYRPPKYITGRFGYKFKWKPGTELAPVSVPGHNYFVSMATQNCLASFTNTDADQFRQICPGDKIPYQGAARCIHTDYSGFKVNEDGTWHVFACSRLTEERVERVVSSADRLVARHLTIRLDAMFQTVQLPAGVAHLNSSLADMDADAFTLQPDNNCVVISIEVSQIYYDFPP